MAGNPAVGAKGQFGFSHEETGKWGRPVLPPANFMEIRSESIVSELASLVSTALRSDRAVHKRISGTEAAGGDVVTELSPCGAIAKLLYHALGKTDTTNLDSTNAYSHRLRAWTSLPTGVTVEVGRDKAAFVYSGCKINTLALSANPSEFVTATFGFMARGGTTASSTDATSPKPLVWGDYRGTDAGVAKTWYVKCSTAGAITGSVARVQFSSDGTTYSTAYTPVDGIPLKVIDQTSVDTGFTVTWFAGDTLAINSIWTISTIKTPTTASYESPYPDPFSGFEGSLTLDGAVAPIMGFSMTLNNNLYGDKYHLGERVRGMLPEQNRSIEGSVKIEFDDLDFYRKFLNRTEGNLIINFQSSTNIGSTAFFYTIRLRLPRVQFTGATPTIGGPEIITVDCPFIALYDDTMATDLEIYVYNKTADLTA